LKGWIWQRLSSFIRGERKPLPETRRSYRGVDHVDEEIKRPEGRREGLKLPPVAL